MLGLIKTLLAHPSTRHASIDSPTTTEERRSIIQEKEFLRRIYDEWYGLIAGQLPGIEGPVLELGSGAGFLDGFVPGLITSEVFFCSHIRAVLDGRDFPFMSQSLRGIVMCDVLHHIPDSAAFFEEANRCLRIGGRILLVEPWVTAFSRFIYTHLHHEPFDPDAPDWKFDSTGPLSGANGALPWIIFERDRARFTRMFPNLAIRKIEPFMPLRYLLSGGVSLRSLTPAATFGFWKKVEDLASPWRRYSAMFAWIVIEKTLS
jgi:SAM-dependent methyltransferase